MGLGLTVDSEPGMVSDRIDPTTDRQERILGFGPTCYLTPQYRYFDADTNDNLLRWGDATGQGYFAPAWANVAVVDEGSGLRSINFTKVAGQALRDVLNLDRLPAPGSPWTIAMLARAPAGQSAWGGILGNRTLYGADMLAYYVDSASGKPNLQMQFGNLDFAIFGNIAMTDDIWHLIIMTGLGDEPGGQVIQDSAAQLLQNNRLQISDDPAARKLLVGDYGPIGTDPFKGQIGGLAIFPVYVGGGDNEDLLADLTAEFNAFRLTLNGEEGGYVDLSGQADDGTHVNLMGLS